MNVLQSVAEEASRQTQVINNNQLITVEFLTVNIVGLLLYKQDVPRVSLTVILKVESNLPLILYSLTGVRTEILHESSYPKES